MKALRTEIRLFISEMLLGWALRVSPRGKEGSDIHVMIRNYFQKKINEQIS